MVAVFICGCSKFAVNCSPVYRKYSIKQSKFHVNQIKIGYRTFRFILRKGNKENSVKIFYVSVVKTAARVSS